MSRRPPPDFDERRAYIEANGLDHGARVLDTALNKIAFIVNRTGMDMLRIRYEEALPPGTPDARRFKLVNPTRLKPAPLSTGYDTAEYDEGHGP